MNCPHRTLQWSEKCQRMDCGYWEPLAQMCSVTAAAVELRRLRETLERIADNLPARQERRG